MSTAAVAAVAASPGPAVKVAGKTEVLWLGQSATRITTPGGKVIVIDPWLIHNPKTPAAFKNLDALGKVDLILVTHAHTDHFEDAPALANKNHAPIVSPQGLQSSLISLNLVPPELAYRMGKGGTAMPLGPGIKITQVHAEHDSELTWPNPTTHKRETYPGGEPVGYIIELENGFKIWHTGDTGPFGDMRLIAETYHPDLLMLPIGGHFVMSPVDAAMVTRDWIRPRYAIPIHYGTTPQLAGTPAEYKAALGNAPVQVIDIQPGQKVDF
ncbi:MAG TPA: metal-dependent hydrolase [Ramlibacter sp.]|nr:metal-dependent hydrolase [Ramlibacter sp.]